MTTRDEVARLARKLWNAEINRKPIEPISSSHPQFNTSDAYNVQMGVANIRAGLGHRLCGRKVGLTSEAVQKMVGLNEPDYGHLFDQMRIEDGGLAKRSELIQPKIEPELAFMFARPLAGPKTSVDDVMEAVDHVAAAFEIVDCRIQEWRVRGIDAVCDNGSASRFVLGRDRFSVRGVDLSSISAAFERNGEVIATPHMSEVMGNPANAVCWLADKLTEQGRRIEAGEVVLTGAPCRPSDVAPGDIFRATFDRLGSVTLSWV